ncbi:Myc-type, basic helix-loop-helix (bHLH) domain-containing protein [Cynara cardunculus var. scolymus]|uniref:Myc-type, basic helix-loop-helix (BHLH) domain-containing protein n=1 Tax=Cynara cardunculus var. scolymus TaxID=59895 RepID=A0A118JWU1_CYNCS|nr:Myc-type, basic helix-loop-helix (bHLH) domain-containing protein [Cynara cardunculus var. scolymus]
MKDGGLKLLLTMQDAHFEEEIQGLIDDLLLQAPMFGGGLIGEAAFTKKHLWMSSEDNYIAHNSSGSIWDMFRDDSKFCSQFSSGIKTIAAIPVEPQGVVQFGSTKKILERTEFIDQTKRMFHEIVNGDGPAISSSSNGLFASLISSEEGCPFSVGSSSAFPPHPFSFGSEPQTLFLDNNQSTTQFVGVGNDGAAPWSTASSLTSFKEPFLSESRGLETWNTLSVQSKSPFPSTNTHQDLFDLPTDFGIPDEFFQTGDFNIAQWYPQSPGQSTVTLGNLTPNDHLLSQATGFLPISSDEGGKSLTISGIDVDLFGSSGDLGDIVTPVINENHLGFDSYNSGHISVSKSTKNVDNHDSATLGQKKGLFSNLGIKELLEGISATSNTASTSCIEDQVSSAAKRRKTGNSVWETSSLQPVVYNKSLKSEPGIWMSDAYSMDGSSTILQAKKQVESPKPTKKKAKPGTRPRPKDRQMILDRMAELRELIPNGEKMSIDCLLDRTIKHMLFLQSVTKHADRIKQADEPKHNGVIPNNYSNDPSNNGVTWACELGNQTMICPLIVEDLSTPGQMLIEMLCEEHGFFLEIVDIIQGFGLTILKGVMEARDEKIWARFIVEAEAKRHVTRHEIFAALVQLLQTMGSNDNHLDKNVMQTGTSILNNFQPSGIQLPVSLADTGYGMNL